MMTRSVKAVCLVLVMSVALSAQTPVTLKSFFQDLIRNFRTSGLPDSKTLLNVQEQVAGMSSGEVSEALPSIAAALNYPDESVQAYGASAIFAVSLRSDSAELLKPYISSVGGLFNSPSNRLQYLAALTLVGLKPSPPPEVLPPMLAYLNSTGPPPVRQVSALAALVRIAPEKPEVIDAVVKFMSRPLDTDTRIAVLNSIHTSRVTDLRVRDAVIATLADSHAGVKLSAIGVLIRMGPDAITQAEPLLQELAQRPSEFGEVRSAANKALKIIGN